MKKKTTGGKAKELFELFERLGEGIHSTLHIIDISDENGITKYRAYHSKGYCLTVYKEEYEPDEDMWENDENYDTENGYYYCYVDDLFEGYKKLDIDDAIELLNKYL